MLERRRAERVDLVDPGVASLRLVQDVEVLQIDADHAEVIAPGPIPRGERLLLEIPMEPAVAPATVLVRAIENCVALDEGLLRRRVRLERIARGAESAPGEDELSRARGAHGPDVRGALIRRVPVRFVQASTGGCVFDCPSMIVEGSVGVVDVRTSRHGHLQAVRISRTWHLPDGVWQYRMAAEFLTLGPASPDSLRGVATLMAAGSDAAVSSGLSSIGLRPGSGLPDSGLPPELARVDGRGKDECSDTRSFSTTGCVPRARVLKREPCAPHLVGVEAIGAQAWREIRPIPLGNDGATGFSSSESSSSALTTD